METAGGTAKGIERSRSAVIGVSLNVDAGVGSPGLRGSWALTITIPAERGAIGSEAHEVSDVRLVLMQIHESRWPEHSHSRSIATRIRPPVFRVPVAAIRRAEFSEFRPPMNAVLSSGICFRARQPNCGPGRRGAGPYSGRETPRRVNRVARSLKIPRTITPAGPSERSTQFEASSGQGHIHRLVGAVENSETVYPAHGVEESSRRDGAVFSNRPGDRSMRGTRRGKCSWSFAVAVRVQLEYDGRRWRQPTEGVERIV